MNDRTGVTWLQRQHCRRSEVVALAEALSHPCYAVRRLLDMAEGWESAPPKPSEPRTPPVPTNRKVRPPVIDALVAGYQRGATMHELAAEFGVGRKTVGKYLRRRGIDTTPPGLPPEAVPTAAELYRKGWTLAQIAEKLNSSAHTVRTRLIEVGVAMRDGHGRER